MSRIQGNTHSNGASSSTTVAVTLTNPVSTASMLPVSVGWANTGDPADTFTVTDDQGNLGYVNVDKANEGIGVDNFSFGTAYILNVTNAPQTITATIKNAGNPIARQFATILVDEFSGIATSGALDGHAINVQTSPATTADAVTSTGITTTIDGDLIYGSTVEVTGHGTIANGTLFTPDISVTGAYMTEHLVQSSRGSIAATFTASASNDNWITSVMAFKSAVPVTSDAFANRVGMFVM